MSLPFLALALVAGAALSAAAFIVGRRHPRPGSGPSARRKAGRTVGLREGCEDTDFVATLLAVTEAALDTPDLERMVQELADRMADIIKADGCYITFWDAERRLSLPAAAYGPYRASYASFRPAHGQRTLTESIAEAGHTLVVEDASRSEHMDPSIAANFNSKSLLGLPMSSDGAILGAVLIGFNRPHRFTEEEISRCEHAARHISFAVAKMRLLEEARHHADELAALNRIGLAINSGRDLDSVISAVFEQCRGIIELDTFYLALYDPEREELRFPLFHDGGKMLHMESRSLAERPGMSGYIIKTRKPLLLADASLPEVQERFGVVRAGGVPSKAYIGVPLICGERVLGVLSVQSHHPDAYTARHLQLVETIAAQSAIAIENAQLYDRLKLLSATDGLTGIFNYRSLSELGPMEFSKARRTGRPLSLVFYDIDHFRDFNTYHGHSAGNAVLEAVTAAVRDCVRSIDVFARYGGEEFVLVLPETPLEEAAAIAERIRSAVEALRVRVPGAGGESGLGVTVSLGVAADRAGLSRFQDLVDEANAAERQAKLNGRNRVELAAKGA